MKSATYLEIAKAVRDTRPVDWPATQSKDSDEYYRWHSAKVQWCTMAHAMANVCEEQCLAFSRTQWAAYVNHETDMLTMMFVSPQTGRIKSGKKD